MANALDTRPQQHEIFHYGGDTLTIRIIVPADQLPEGAEWSAEVKSARDSAVPDATFSITPPAVPGDPAYLVLSSEDTSILAAKGVPIVQKRQQRGSAMPVASSAVQYTGQWDCQISGVGGADPVRTIAQGSITIEQDVTR